MNYKELPFKTVWVQFPDIEATCKAAGIPPTSTWADDGAPMYTLPAIHDPNTGTTLADSAAIARYLDAAYPDAPRCIPAGTDAFHALFEDALGATVFMPLAPLVLPLVPGLVPAEHREVYRAGRLRQGMKLDEIAPKSAEAREQQWGAVEAAFGKVAGWLDVGGQPRTRFMGDVASYADLVLAAMLISMRRAVGEESEEWKRVAGWHGGRWAAFLEEFGRFERYHPA